MLKVGAPYFEAPGLAIVTLGNRNFRWDVERVPPRVLGVGRDRSRSPCSRCAAGAASRPLAAVLAVRLAADRPDLRDEHATPTTRTSSRRCSRRRATGSTGTTHGGRVTFLGQGVDRRQPALARPSSGTATLAAGREPRRHRARARADLLAGPRHAPTASSTTTRRPYTLAGERRRSSPRRSSSQRDGLTLYRTRQPVAPARPAAERLRRRAGRPSRSAYTLLPARRPRDAGRVDSRARRINRRARRRRRRSASAP